MLLWRARRGCADVALNPRWFSRSVVLSTVHSRMLRCPELFSFSIFLDHFHQLLVLDLLPDHASDPP